MAQYTFDLEGAVLSNEYYRKVIYTDQKTQIVLMCLLPGEYIENEIHDNITQFFRISEGSGYFLINGRESVAQKGHAVIVPAGTHHFVKNAASEPLKLYTIYSPPEHPPGTEHVRMPIPNHSNKPQSFPDDRPR